MKSLFCLVQFLSPITLGIIAQKMYIIEFMVRNGLIKIMEFYLVDISHLESVGFSIGLSFKILSGKFNHFKNSPERLQMHIDLIKTQLELNTFTIGNHLHYRP